MIDRNHPAVKAAHFASLGKSTVSGQTWADALTAALPHLTADDLRHTPAGRELMAETWQEGAMGHAEATSRMTPETRRIINELMKAANPYLERSA